MKFSQIAGERLILSMDIHEIAKISKILEETAFREENMKALYDLDQVIFAYHRELEEKS